MEGYEEGSYHNMSSYGVGGSKRWRSAGKRMNEKGFGCGGGKKKMKRVMVVVDESRRARHAMMWALTHVADKGDLMTLLHVLPQYSYHHHHLDDHGVPSSDYELPQLANSLTSLCKACKPEVEVEALVIQGPKLATVLCQVRKLEITVLVLSQAKPSLFCCLLRSSSEEFVEQCIEQAGCLTLAVKKQSKGVGGYLVSSRFQKNFWLLA